ncbi:hypothetical protein FEDK69T_30490 [Flavobacterium enshiense DK69]|uniref:Uncharacterized protein n=2 Tax=Flavobacterium TaxID=237 RepID=V6S0F9_9FLAO|nr:hypothetical protein FEDK69T_30490 [Flavobacterium enshiense DK69]KGO92617.1 hypothetical protein Q767_15595 [Flavobacterium enshiense DK69]
MLVFINGIIGHYYPPKGIDFTLILIPIVTLIMCFASKNLNSIFKSLSISMLVIINDILIKLYSGGTHDLEGLEWIHAFMYMGIIIGLIILSINVIKNKEENIFLKISSILLIPLLVYIYQHFFYQLGLGRQYPI